MKLKSYISISLFWLLQLQKNNKTRPKLLSANWHTVTRSELEWNNITFLPRLKIFHTKCIYSTRHKNDHKLYHVKSVHKVHSPWCVAHRAGIKKLRIKLSGILLQHGKVIKNPN